MTAKIMSKFVWCNAMYYRVLYSDGTNIELRSDLPCEYTDEDWIQLALDLYNNRPAEPDPLYMCLTCVSDEELVAEVVRRHLVVTAEGGVVDDGEGS